MAVCVCACACVCVRERERGAAGSLLPSFPPSSPIPPNQNRGNEMKWERKREEGHNSMAAKLPPRLFEQPPLVVALMLVLLFSPWCWAHNDHGGDDRSLVAPTERHKPNRLHEPHRPPPHTHSTRYGSDDRKRSHIPEHFATKAREDIAAVVLAGEERPGIAPRLLPSDAAAVPPFMLFDRRQPSRDLEEERNEDALVKAVRGGPGYMRQGAAGGSQQRHPVHPATKRRYHQPLKDTHDHLFRPGESETAFSSGHLAPSPFRLQPFPILNLFVIP